MRVVRYRAAEKVAKERKLRLWREHTSAAPKSTATHSAFTGIVGLLRRPISRLTSARQVTEIVSPENIVVSVDGVSKRVSFSSLRQPRIESKVCRQGCVTTSHNSSITG